MDSIFHRTSVRSWTDEPVEDALIERVLKAGMQAPSAGDQRPWEFYVVSDAALSAELSHVSRWAGCAAHAPVVIVSAYRTEGLVFPEYAQIDLSIATEHMWLEADSLGLGGVWLGIAPVEERMARVSTIVGIPQQLKAFALLCLGHPAKDKPQKDRFDASRIHWVKGTA